MTINKYFCIIGLFVFMNTLNAQVVDAVRSQKVQVLQLGDTLINRTFYTGINGYFVLSFVNDSIVQARFFEVDQLQWYQKIHYYSNGDTIVLHNSKQNRVPYSVCGANDVKSVGINEGIPVIVKYFYSNQNESIDGRRERLLLHEEVLFMDSLVQHLYIPYKAIPCRYSNLIMLNYGGYFVRLQKDIDTSYEGWFSNDYLKIDMSPQYLMWGEALFNEFPLVLQGDTIYPIDAGKNYQCWIDNGFFFPIMVKGKDDPWEARDIPANRIGLEGTKFEY